MTPAGPALYERAGDPLDYPGVLAPTGLLVAGGRAEPIRFEGDRLVTTDGDDVDHLLASIGAAPVGERVAQAAFGANRDVRNVRWKLEHHDPRPAPVGGAFVVLPGVVPDADVVACNVGYWGYVYGGLLVAGPSALGRRALVGLRCPVAVLLLDESQMRAIHATEGVVRPGEERPGVSCRIAEIEVELTEDVACVAQAYSLDVPFLSFDGVTPLPLAQVATVGRRLPAATQRELIDGIAVRIGAISRDPGVASVATDLRRRAHQVRRGPEVADHVGSWPRFERLRASIEEHLALGDADGRVRRGFEGIVDVRTPDRAYEASPVFRPA